MEKRVSCPKYGRCAVQGVENEIIGLEHECIKVEALIEKTDPDDTKHLDIYNNRLTEYTDKIAFKHGEIFNIACSSCPLV